MKRLTIAAILTSVALSVGQEKIPPRYNVEADVDRLPQKSPKDTLRSVLAAIEAKRINYLLAHLADPAFVDERVKNTGGRFDVMVQETAKKFESNPESVREMRKFLTDGDWKEDSKAASATCKDIRGKAIYFKKIGNRWFLENRTEPAKPGKDKDKDKDNDRPAQ